MKKSELFMKFEKVSDQGIISGFISKYGEIDSYGSTTVKGCFAEAIARVEAGEVIPVLWQHDPHEPIGKFKSIRETDEGPYAEIELDLNVARAKEAFSLVKNDVISGLSIGGIIDDYDYDDSDVLQIKSFSLWETSVVTFPACESARIDDFRAKEPTGVRFLEQAFRKSGAFTRSESKKIASFFENILKNSEIEVQEETRQEEAETVQNESENSVNEVLETENAEKVQFSVIETLQKLRF